MPFVSHKSSAMPRLFGPEPPNWLLAPSPRRPRVRSPPANSLTFPNAFRVMNNAVYYPNWTAYRDQPPSSLNIDVISHVFYAFAWVKDDGTVYLSDEEADLNMDVDGVKGCLQSLALLKSRHRFLKVILSVGGGGKGSENFAAVAADVKTRNTFARTARNLVVSHGLDGIDIDWEHPQNEKEGLDYLRLVSCARSYLPSPLFQLTSALPAGEWALRHIPVDQVARKLDLLNVMAYDFYGSWTTTSGHQSQLWGSPRDRDASATPTEPSGNAAIKYLLSRGVPALKMLLGIPVYGRSFLGVNGPDEEHKGHAGEDGTFDYRELPRPGATEHVDASIGAAFCVGGDGGFVSYDTLETVRIKAEYARNNGLGGLFYWNGPGDAKGERSLVQRGYMSLHPSY